MAKKIDEKPATDVSRRNILLAGTTLAAASALAGSTPIRSARAQQQQPATAPSGQRPNILVIFGDDIGQTNVSAYSFGVMGYKTEHRSYCPRGHDVHGLLCRAELHGRTLIVHHRPSNAAHGPI